MTSFMPKTFPRPDVGPFMPCRSSLELMSSR